MGLRFMDLTNETRALMLEEIDIDLAAHGIYISNYLTEGGALKWPDLLKEAAKSGNDDSLAESLRRNVCFKTKVERRKPKGGFTLVNVPTTAAQTLAESQFNMYYMRALARQSQTTGKNLLVYRAKEVEIPRTESELMINTTLNAEEVLRVLRETRGVEPVINIPMPNTGITVRLA